MPDKSVPGVCRLFNSPKSDCTREDCRELHVCFHFATGDCRYGDNCKKTHLLTTVHNKTVLKAHGWVHDNQHPKILKLLAEKFKKDGEKPQESKADGVATPQVCFNYNMLGCGGGSCQNLHLCLNSILNKCALGSKCHLEHDLVKSEQNIRVLRNAKLLDTEQRVIVDNLREKYLAMAAQKIKEDVKQKDPVSKQKEKSGKVQGEQESLAKKATDKDKPKSQATPSACIAYNKGGCNKASCPFLHVCFSYVMGTCDKKGNCLKEHNIFKGEQNKEVLRKFNLLGAKDVFAKIQKGYEARAAAKAAALESSEGATGGASPSPSPSPLPGAARRGTSAPASLTCSVCCEPFVRATTLGCTHTFCEDCVRRTERQRQPCPLCRAPIATAVRSLVIDDTVAEWFDTQDEATQLARRQLEADRRREATVPQPLMAAKAEPPKGNGGKPAPAKNKPQGNRPPHQHQHRSQSRGRGAKTVVTTTVTYH